jgi:hypothetical protein
MVTTLLKSTGSQKVVGSNPISSTSLFSTLITTGGKAEGFYTRLCA